MSVHDERRQLAATFDRAGGLYHRARPDYPNALYDHLLQVTHLSPAARLLEIGCATGKATLPLAQRGFHITCIEPGAALAAAARANLTGLDVDVVQAHFEDWVPVVEEARRGVDRGLAGAPRLGHHSLDHVRLACVPGRRR